MVFYFPSDMRVACSSDGGGGAIFPSERGRETATVSGAGGGAVGLSIYTSNRL